MLLDDQHQRILAGNANTHAATFDNQFPFGEKLDRLGIGNALLFEHACGQPIGRIVVQNWHGPLQYNGAVVELIVGKMNGATRYFGPIIQHGFMHMVPVHPFATKRGKQCRMNIQDPMKKIVSNAKQLQKSRHTDEMCACCSACVKDRVAMCLRIRERTPLYQADWQTGVSSPLDSPHPRLAGDDLNDPGC